MTCTSHGCILKDRTRNSCVNGFGAGLACHVRLACGHKGPNRLVAGATTFVDLETTSKLVPMTIADLVDVFYVTQSLYNMTGTLRAHLLERSSGISYLFLSTRIPHLKVAAITRRMLGECTDLARCILSPSAARQQMLNVFTCTIVALTRLLSTFASWPLMANYLVSRPQRWFK